MSTVPPIRTIPLSGRRLRRPPATMGAATIMARECVLFLGAALAYFAVRGLTVGSAETARENAEGILVFERAIGIAHESELQGLILDNPSLVTLANWVYIWGHWPLIAGVAIWLCLRRPSAYRLMRNAIFAAGAIGIVIFALFPVMPPRLGVMEVVDTVSANSQSYRALQPPALVNPFAAFPSLHVGFNLIVGVVLWREASSWPLRAAAVASVAAMSAAVVLTANHYIIDVPAGMAVAGLGLLIAFNLERLRPALSLASTAVAGQSWAADRSAAEQARVLNLDASVHHHRDPGRVGTLSGLGMGDPQLHPDRPRADGDRLVDHRRHVLGAPEDVDDPDRPGRRGRGEIRATDLAQHIGAARVYGRDGVAGALHVRRDLVAGPVGLGRQADDGEVGVGE